METAKNDNTGLAYIEKWVLEAQVMIYFKKRI